MIVPLIHLPDILLQKKKKTHHPVHTWREWGIRYIPLIHLPEHGYSKKYPPMMGVGVFCSASTPQPLHHWPRFRWLHQWQETLRCQTWQNLGAVNKSNTFLFPKTGGKFSGKKNGLLVNDTQKWYVGKKVNMKRWMSFLMWIQSCSICTAKLQSFLTKIYPTMPQLFKNLGPTCLVNKEQVKHGRCWNCFRTKS